MITACPRDYLLLLFYHILYSSAAGIRNIKLLSASLNSGQFVSDHTHPSILASPRTKKSLTTDIISKWLKLLKDSQRIKHMMQIKLGMKLYSLVN